MSKHKTMTGRSRDRIIKGPINQRVLGLHRRGPGPKAPKVKPGSQRAWKLEEDEGESLTTNMLRTKLRGVTQRKECNR